MKANMQNFTYNNDVKWSYIVTYKYWVDSSYYILYDEYASLNF